MERKIDLSEVWFKLENAENFLICFSEFCDAEGNCTEKGEAGRIAAVCFVNRFPQFAPLLNHAINIIHEQREVIKQAYTCQEEGVHQNAPTH